MMGPEHPEVGMNVAAILSAKGNTVEVVGPDTPITVAVHRMATRNIGSLVVVGPDDQLVGVVGERDIVKALEHHGVRFSDLRVRDVVNAGVATCTVTDDLAEVMRRMTTTRSRHLPVLDGTQVVGLVSIGDVVKHRLGELELETHVLRDVYLSRS
jgi:CBS domain-containing protein